VFSSGNLETILAALPDPAFIFTRSGLYAAVYGGQDNRYYHDGSPLIGHSIRDIMEKPLADLFIGVIEKALASSDLCIFEYPLSASDFKGVTLEGPTDQRWFEGRIKRLPFKVGGEDAVLWVGSNITERHRLETDLRRLSQTDPLTGLWNRRHFETIAIEDLRLARASGRPLAALMIDADHFKPINDDFGHATGDKVLIELATILTRSLRDGDTAARWGGEEFLVLSLDGAVGDVLAFAEHLRASVAGHVFAHGLGVTVSIGVAVASPDVASLDSLVVEADAALYAAKAAGRNCVRFGGRPAWSPELGGAVPLMAASWVVDATD
jgi:diguanylate cyclase (GGDEF)-like protein